MYLRKTKAVLIPALLAFCVITFLPAGNTYALDPNRAITQYILRVWREEDGLTTKDIDSIVQTRDGYIWMGSVDGLVRFDGVRFRLFTSENTEGIVQSYVSALLEDRDGDLWIGTYGGGIERYHNGRFTALTTKDGLSSGMTRALLQTKDGSLWIGTESGLNRLKDGKITVFNNNGVPGANAAISLFEDSAGTLWVGTNKGLFKFHDDAFTPVQTITDKDVPISCPVYSVCQTSDGSLWFALFGGGLDRLADGKLTCFSSSQGLSSNFVTRTLQDHNGNLWIGTQGGGLNRYRDGRFTTITQEQGLSSNLVSSICEDREGSLWVGTYYGTGGLNQLRDGKFVTFTSTEGLTNSKTWSIIQDRNDGSIWIAAQGGINHLKDGKITRHLDKALPEDVLVRCLWQTRDGAIWAGTEGNGLLRLQKGKFALYTKKDGLSSNSVYSLCEGSDGNLWIGTDAGLDVLEKGKIHSYSAKDGLPSNVIKVAYQDRSGKLWFGGNNGLSEFRDGKFTVYNTGNGLSNNLVRSLYNDADGALWIGTLGGGLDRLKDGKLSAIGTASGLYDNVIWGIVEDDLGNLWMSSNKGLFKVSLRELNDVADGRSNWVHSFEYGKADGLKGVCAGGSSPSASRTRDGKLWFPTFGGALEIDPERIPVNQLAPNVVIDQAVADRISLDPTREREIPPGRGVLEFHYTALSLAAPNKVAFKYRLEGYDSDWVDAGSRRVAFYTNIPPGRYVFHVIACNNDGVWNEQGARIGLYLKAHFYQSYWFYSLVGLVLVGSAISLFRLRVRQIRERANELEVLVQLRTEELKQFTEQLERSNKELESFAYIASHDLQEPLRKVQTFGDRLKAKFGDAVGQEGADYINRMQKATARMQTLISDLLVFSRVTSKPNPMQKVDLGAVAREVISDLEVRVEKTGANVELGDLPEIEADPLQMRQLFQNLVGNSLKFVRPDSAPIVRISGRILSKGRAASGNGAARRQSGAPDGLVELVVEDNGIGFDQKYAERIFSPFQRLTGKDEYEGTGIGLAICQKIVQRHGGTIRAEGDPGAGSRFIIRLPLAQPPN